MRSSDFSPPSGIGESEHDAGEARGWRRGDTRESGGGGGAGGSGRASSGAGGGGGGGGDRDRGAARGGRVEEVEEDVYDFDATSSSRYCNMSVYSIQFFNHFYVPA